MSRRLIHVGGCDDSTNVILDLTDAEYAVVQRVAKAVTAASRYGCQPTIETATDGEAHFDWTEAVES